VVVGSSGGTFCSREVGPGGLPYGGGQGQADVPVHDSDYFICAKRKAVGWGHRRTGKQIDDPHETCASGKKKLPRSRKLKKKIVGTLFLQEGEAQNGLASGETKVSAKGGQKRS